jgi:hypothetical protein
LEFDQLIASSEHHGSFASKKTGNQTTAKISAVLGTVDFRRSKICRINLSDRLRRLCTLLSTNKLDEIDNLEMKHDWSLKQFHEP